ncbi:hypothetical protein [Cystobacter fuscus]|uniref:hypothetical protein n=1 Tax=Cystobacter fuscus TaxID=43 RepID=UPI0012DC986E|nr:hypothetical protein [Cystobacter fuscus]
MLKISKEQMQALSLSRELAFTQRMVQHLVNSFTAELKIHDLSEQDVEPLVRRGMKEANSFGVVSERDVEFYIGCMVVLHPDFARHPRFPWAEQVLRSHELSGSEKIDHLHNHLIWRPAHKNV